MVTLFIIGIGAVLLFAIAFRSPSKFHVERSVTIDAPIAVVYPMVEDLHSWSMWSPYEKLDSKMQKTFSGSPLGVGAVYEWSGNAKAGSGMIEITQATPAIIVLILDMFRPFKAHNTVRFTFTPQGNGTAVTWAMDGTSPYLMRLVGLFMDMDRMVGRDFEEGLMNLKEAVEMPEEVPEAEVEKQTQEV